VVEPTPLKNISQNGNLPQIGVKMKKEMKPPPRLCCVPDVICGKCLQRVDTDAEKGTIAFFNSLV